ncbi:hypothetical protein [Amycolatopsis sp. NPDC051071]|uniref:hypothetical protein n=1 Tax=Amycolatopsis sp. NPDC051071 TaxID=3154637 RepID=UPI003438C00C
MVTNHSPRSASVLLSGALARLDVVQPETLRGPVRDILRAGIELCTVSQSLIGLPIRFTLDLAQAIMEVEISTSTQSGGKQPHSVKPGGYQPIAKDIPVSRQLVDDFPWPC